MSVNSNALERRLKKRASLTDTNLLLIITIIVFIVMYLCAVVFLKKGFTKPQMFFNILNENASLLVLSCGMTLVMITGGIDISVGQVTCLVCMACAVHLQKVNDGVINGSVFTSLLIAIAIGLAFGIVQGFLVAYMEFQPFIVTLAGLFFGRKCPSRVWFSVLLAVGGLYFLCIRSGEKFSIGIGELSVFLCAFAFTAQILCVDRFVKKTDPVALSCAQFFLCFVFCSIGAVLTEEIRLPELTACIPYILYVGVFSSGISPYALMCSG